jgi:exosome complex exonuclease RRP6
MLLQISEILPREPQGVRACCNPVPLLVHHNLHDIHQIILQVRDIPLIEVKEIFNSLRKFYISF